jgi:methionine-rich copper-binding protein CopC
VFLALAAAAAAYAHAHLERAVPPDGSVLHAAPAQLVLTLSEPARLTVLWIEPAGGERHKVAALPAQLAREIAVALPPLAPGKYVIEWRALSADGHVVPGQIHFTLLR